MGSGSEDPGISHAHAVSLTGPDGCSIVDLGSVNSTCLNDGTEPIEADRPQPVRPGDRIHVGAWTTLTLLEPIDAPPEPPRGQP